MQTSLVLLFAASLAALCACSSTETQPSRTVDPALTAEVEVLAVKPDKPVCQLKATITNQDGTAVLEGECWTYTLRPR